MDTKVYPSIFAGQRRGYGRIYKPLQSPFYWVDVSVNGKRYRRSAKTNVWKDAVTFLENLRKSDRQTDYRLLNALAIAKSGLLPVPDELGDPVPSRPERFSWGRDTCAICSCGETRKRRDGTPAALVVDHDHKTGQWRGRLCYNCNSGIGLMKDSVDVCLSAASYLAYWKED